MEKQAAKKKRKEEKARKKKEKVRAITSALCVVTRLHMSSVVDSGLFAPCPRLRGKRRPAATP